MGCTLSWLKNIHARFFSRPFWPVN